MAAELDQNDQDDRGDVDAAEIGQSVADRTKERFGQPMQKLPNLVDVRVRSVNHAKLQKPAQDDRDDDGNQKQPEEGIEQVV